MSKGTSDHYQDKHLEDIGWARMKSILDKEMPQKKRRFLWLPLYGGIAASFAIVGLATYLLIGTGNGSANQMTAMQQTEVQVEPDGQANRHLSGQEEPAFTNTEFESPAVEEIDVLAKTGDKKLPEVSSPIASAQTTTDNARVDVQKEIATASTPGVDHRQGESMDSRVGSRDLPEEETRGDHITDSKLIDRERRTETHIALLPHLSSIISYDDEFSIRIYRDTFRSEVSDVVEFKNRKFSVEVGASALADLPLRTFSWDGGLNLRYRFSRKIGISTGLFFWRLHSSRSFYTNQYSSNNSSVRENSDWFVDLSNRQADTLQLAGSTDKLNYMRVPIKVQFFPENRLSPSVGVSRIWHVGGLQSMEDQFLADFSQGFPTMGGSLSIASPEIVRKNNWTVDLGVTWKITDHFLTDFSISRGLKSYVNYDIQGSDFSELHNHYRLSMFYRF